MSKLQAALAIGTISFGIGLAWGLSWWTATIAILNAIFIHEFLTMKGH